MNNARVKIKQNKKIFCLLISIIISLFICIAITCVISLNKTQASGATLAELKAQVAEAEQMYVQAQIEKATAEAKAEDCKKTIEYAN